MSQLGLRLTANSSRAAAHWQSRWPASTSTSMLRSRHFHYRKELPYPVENGLADFLSPDALKMVAVDYQNGLLDRLNDQIRGMSVA